MDHRTVIEDLYEGLRSSDGDAMAACYTDDARFQDPAFGELTDGSVREMWRMLTSQSSGIDVDVTGIVIDGNRGRAQWTARYVFGATGRHVVNRGLATYRFRDGLIVEHVDEFSLWRWSSQALGPVGVLLGWSPMMRKRVQRRARRALRSHTEKSRGSGE